MRSSSTNSWMSTLFKACMDGRGVLFTGTLFIVPVGSSETTGTTQTTTNNNDWGCYYLFNESLQDWPLLGIRFLFEFIILLLLLACKRCWPRASHPSYVPDLIQCIHDAHRSADVVKHHPLSHIFLNSPLTDHILNVEVQYKLSDLDAACSKLQVYDQTTTD